MCNFYRWSFSSCARQDWRRCGFRLY